MRLLISSPFHNGTDDTFHLYFDCGTYTDSGDFTQKVYYIAKNYRYNSPDTYIKKTNDVDCRPYLKVESEPGVIYTGPDTSEKFTITNYYYRF